MNTTIQNEKSKALELINDGENYTKFAGKKVLQSVENIENSLKNSVILSKKDFEFILKNSKNIDYQFKKIYKKEGIKEAIKYLYCIS